MPELYHQSSFEDGTRLVTERIEVASSVSLGIWIAAGSRDEGFVENGLAHLIEHMVFKGTATRDKLALAREMDRLGGLANAFTSREHTCYHTRVRPEQLPLAVELLLDIYQNSLYDDEELLLEKQVIAQEIAMVEDDPEEFVHDLAAEAVWPDHCLGRPVAGSLKSLDGLDRRAILDWLKRHYTGSRLVISAAGAVEHQELADLLSSKLLCRKGEPRVLSTPAFTSGLLVKCRDLEQAHLVITTAFPHIRDEQRHAASVLNWAFGGNMSSRLFQEIRENRGLAYSVYSSYSAYEDLGTLEIYAASLPEKAMEVYDVILHELEDFKRCPLTGPQLQEAVEGLTTSLILGGESMDSRMSRLGRNELIHGHPISLEETCQALGQVTIEELAALAEEFWVIDNLATCVLGPVKGFTFK